MRPLAALLALHLSIGSSVAASCLREAGPRLSSDLVRQCRDVSAATRPPCNAENACALIVEEIRRGCEALGAEAPNFCGLYAEDDEEEDGDDDSD